jgi:hypothetical protein
MSSIPDPGEFRGKFHKVKFGLIVKNIRYGLTVMIQSEEQVKSRVKSLNLSCVCHKSLTTMSCDIGSLEICKRQNT